MKKNNRILPVLMAIALTFTAIISVDAQVLAAENSEQENISLSQWAQEDVGMAYSYKLADNELFKDYQKNVTREELFTVCENVYEKLTGISVEPAKSTPFSDTNSKELLKAYNTGIITDTYGGSFQPEKTVTREETASALYNLLRVSEPDFNLNVSSDLELNGTKTYSEPVIKAVSYLYSNGIVKGKTSSSLDLMDNCSREEMLALQKRVYEFAVQESGKASKGCLWKVSGGKSQVYLLGSIHVADMSLFPFSRSIENAFSKADYLAVEADIKPSNDAIKYMAEKAIINDGTTIESKISADTYKAYAETMKSFNIPEITYNTLKPWYAAMLIPNLTLAKSSISGSTGVDMYMMNRAVGKKKLIEIEGVKFQVDLFDNFSPMLQEEYLKNTLAATKNNGNSSNQEVEMTKAMLDSWKAGDLSAFKELVEASSTQGDEFSKEFNKKLLDERNANMGKKVLEFLNDDSGKTYFVMVGAAHYFGDTGILKTLEANGYKVEQLRD